MKYKRDLGFFLILIGLILIASSSFGITGAMISEGFIEWTGSIIGLAFLIGGCVVLMASSIDNKFIRSKVKNDPFLLKIAQAVGRNPPIRKDVNHLINEFNKGNVNPGIGTKTISKGVYELRGRNGGRVYFKQINKDKYEIIGYSDKTNQVRVIDYLKELYP